jgi:hypothetical protein
MLNYIRKIIKHNIEGSKGSASIRGVKTLEITNEMQMTCRQRELEIVLSPVSICESERGLSQRELGRKDFVYEWGFQ